MGDGHQRNNSYLGKMRWTEVMSRCMTAQRLDYSRVGIKGLSSADAPASR